MSDPKRLGESSEALRAMLRAAKPRAMRDDERARSAANIAALAAAPIVGGAAAAKLGGAKTIAILAAFGALGAIAAIAVATRGPSKIVDSSAGSAVVASSAPRVVVSSIVAPIESSSAPVAASSSAPIAIVAPSSSPSANANDVEAETALVARARQSLSNDPAATLSACAEHRAKFPSGLLAMERDLLEIRALHRLGRDDEANEKARAFLVRYPSSPYAAEVEASTKGP